MKTVIDAVNEFKCCMPVPSHAESKTQVIMAVASFESYEYGELTTGDGVRDNEYWNVICTREQFNDLVSQMETNFGKCANIDLFNYTHGTKQLLTKSDRS
tara:strand:+ start:440 stop:739 length:300 start_codon:yes stop_codon:yes gene_type:complete